MKNKWLNVHVICGVFWAANSWGQESKPIYTLLSELVDRDPVQLTDNSREQEFVSIESLLTEMVDRDSVARFPQQNFRLKQHSSYNRASKTPDHAKGWFTNQDYNPKRANTENFIRTEENNGRKEWVLMDHQAPGAIVRTWMPWLNQLKPGTKTNMRVYLDGAEEPAFEGNMLGLFNGTGLIPYPFAHSSLRSAVSFFPIPYAKSCKITTDSKPFFYQFTFREYPEGTPIKTFTLADFNATKELTEATGKQLLHPTAVGAGDPQKFSVTLADQVEKSLQLPAGVAAVRELSVKLGDYSNPNITRLVVLKIEFDGKPTVWCPIGDFFGSGIGLNPVEGWYRTVAEDGTMSCRWVMPYQTGAKVSLLNLSGAPVDAELEVKTGDWKWDEDSMYFHAAWRGQYPVPTRPFSDWNYVTVKGKGVYVGDTLTIMNPVESWWGEGDEKIWVDGEDFPSIFGTGTEDYYAYSWGGRSTDFYQHPFHAQPFANQYNKLNRKPESDASRNTQGFSVETRSRALDTMPFGSSLQLDMEVWAGKDCDMGYQVGTYWYGFNDTTSNRKPEPVEVLNVAPLPEAMRSSTAYVAPIAVMSKAPSAAPAIDADPFSSAVEIGPKQVVSKSGTITLKPQNLKKLKLKGEWNKENHLLFNNPQVGGVVDLRIPASSPVEQTLSLYATKSRNFGVLRISVNGKPAVSEVDLYAAKPVPSGAIQLGTFAPVNGAYLVRVEVVGKNAKSKGVFFGLDCVTLK